MCQAKGRAAEDPEGGVNFVCSRKSESVRSELGSVCAYACQQRFGRALSPRACTVAERMCVGRLLRRPLAL